MKRLMMILLGSVLLTACASSQTSSFGNVAAVMAEQHSAKGKMLIVNVPDANNPVSNSMMIASLAGGTVSNSVKGIMGALAVSDARIGISGSSNAVNVATLQRALKNFTGSSNAAVYIDASAEQLQALNQLARPKNIQVYGVQRPHAE